jgi:hypothetical protein
LDDQPTDSRLDAVLRENERLREQLEALQRKNEELIAKVEKVVEENTTFKGRWFVQSGAKIQTSPLRPLQRIGQC